MSATAVGASGSSSVTDGAPSAATATSVSRTCVGSALEPFRDKGAKALGQEDVDAVGVDRAVGQRAPDLEREERVPARGIVHAHEHRPGQVQRQPPPQEPVDRPDRERRHGEPPEPREGAAELERRLGR